MQLGLTLGKLDREKLYHVVKFCCEFQDEEIWWNRWDAEDRRRSAVPLLRRYLRRINAGKKNTAALEALLEQAINTPSILGAGMTELEEDGAAT